jgi:hypothetical protein
MKKLALLAVLAISFNSFAQTTNRLVFQKGQKLEVTREVKIAATTEFMGQSMEQTINSTTTEVLDVQDAGEKGTTFEHKIKRLLINAEGMGQKQSFDSEKEGDRSGEMGKIFEKSLKNKYTFSVDPAGKITSVKADDDNPNDEETKMMVQMASQQMGIDLSLPTVGKSSQFKILPAYSIKKGDTWTDTTSEDGEKRSINYTVAEMNNNEILLDFTSTMSVSKTQDIMGTEATINSNGKSTGRVVIDRKSSVLKQRTENGEVTGTIEAQGQSIPTSGKTTITVTVKPA